jgi:chromosome segregation ATPase
MLFNTGDIIVLAIVFLVLFLNRQFDKNNRSLEKVRKYADKVKDELDKLVKDKKTEIHDLNIDIEVQEKTNREILKRILQANEESQNRSEELESYKDRLGDVSGRLEELDTLTKNVDENLVRIKKESEYVDSVGVRLNKLLEKTEGLTAGMTSLHESFRKENAQALEELQKSFHGEMTTVYKQFLNNLEASGEKLDQFQGHVDELLESRDRIGKEKLDAFTAQWTSVEDNYLARLEKVASEGVALESDSFLHLKELLSSHTESLSASWNNEMQRLERRFQNLSEELNNGMESLDENHTLWKNRSDEQILRFNDHLAAATGEQQSTLKAMKDELEAMMQDFSATRTGMVRQKDEVEQELERLDSRLGAHKSNVDAQLQEFADTFTGRIEETAETLQIEALKAIEKKLKEYESGFFPRFNKLEQFMNDMDTLESSLRMSMNEVSERVMSEFSAFDLKMKNLRSDEERDTDERAEKIRMAMNELEQGLDELKSRAYDNVSAQLQVFEDDFFTDLKKRDDSIQNSLRDWQENLDRQITDLADQQNRDRVEMERSCSAELNKRLGELQTRVSQQFEKFQTQVVSFRESLDSRVDEGNSLIISYREDLQNKVSTMRDESMDFMVRELERLSMGMNERVEVSEKDINQKLNLLMSDLDQSRREFSIQSETIQSDVTSWQQKILQQIKDDEAQIRESYDEFKTSITSDLNEIRDDFKSQKEELILSSNEERADLKQDLAAMSEKVYQLQTDLKDKSESTLERFNSDYNLFMLDFQKKLRESQNDAELKIREMRQGVNDAREKMDAYQKKLVTRVEEDSRHLTSNLEEIERKQQDFIAQTHIFEKADRLKETLSRNILELKGDLQKVDSNMDRLKDYQAGFDRVQDQYQGILDQINRFMEEKQKVEELEDKIRSMVSLSKSVDLKLDQVSSLHDMLQQYQSRVKELEDQHHALDSRFVRMESKAILVDKTVEQVDEYTITVETLQKSIDMLKNELNPLSGRLKDIEQRNTFLLENKESADSVYSKIASLDQVLADLDEKAEKINQARDWIARTETRMDGVVKQAQDQVKLLGRLAERDGSAPRAGGSPDMDTRETVLRLARLGWKTEDIARTLKLSRGEVELILEITPRS